MRRRASPAVGMFAHWRSVPRPLIISSCPHLLQKIICIQVPGVIELESLHDARHFSLHGVSTAGVQHLRLDWPIIRVPSDERKLVSRDAVFSLVINIHQRIARLGGPILFELVQEIFVGFSLGFLTNGVLDDCGLILDNKYGPTSVGFMALQLHLIERFLYSRINLDSRHRHGCKSGGSSELGSKARTLEG